MRLISAKLTKRYFLITIIVIFIVLFSIYVINTTIMKNSFERQIKYRDNMIAATLAKKIEFSIKKMVNDVKFVARYVSSHGGNEVNWSSQEIQELLVNEPLYLSIELIGKDGRLVSRFPEIRRQGTLDLGTVSDRLAWSKTLFVTDMLELPGGKKTFAIAYPLLAADGAYRGGVVAFVNLGTLSDYLRESQIGAAGMAALVDRQGGIIAHSDERYIGRSLARHPLGVYLNKDRYGIWEGDLFGRQVIVSYRPLYLGTFGLVVGESSAQAWAPSDQVAFLLFQGFLVVLLVAAGLNLYGTSRVVKPILALTRQAREYQESKRKSFDPIPTRDEIEDLSRTMGQMAQALTDRERRLFYILESIPYGVVTLDPEGRITSFNRGAEELSGYRRREVVGRPIIDLPFKPSQEEFLSWRTLQEGEEFEEAETYILDKQQKRHDIRLHSSLFRGENDELLGAILVLRDVSEIKKLEDYLQQSERLAALGKLTAGVAHEIKNPLSIIHAAAEAIQLEVDDGDGESVRGLAADILATSERMNRLLGDFLSLSRGGDEEPRQAVDLVAILEELIQLLKKKFHDQEVRLSLNRSVPAAAVLGHRNRITQVFLNIFLNSLQATAPGGSLTVSLEEAGESWEVVIADTGKGIPEAEMQWIFNPFFSTKREGTGLGLSIAYEIMADHDGKIWATSSEGAGTTMHVQFPKA